MKVASFVLYTQARHCEERKRRGNPAELCNTLITFAITHFFRKLLCYFLLEESRRILPNTN